MIVYFLDSVIHLLKKVDLEQNKTFLQEGKTIMLDAEKGEILHKKPILGFGRDIRYYWVSTRNSAHNETECQVTDFLTGQSIVIKIKYEVKCEPGSEEKVVLALHKGNHPGATLNKMIENLIREFVKDKRKNGMNPVLDYYKYCGEFKQYIYDKITINVGLKIDFILFLKDEDKLKEYEIESDYFPVRLKGCEDELTLKFKTGLKINEKNKIFAIIKYNQLGKLEDLLQKVLKDYVLEEISLHDFVYNLNTTVKVKMEVAINKVLEKNGREVAWLSLETSFFTTLPPKFRNIDHTVKCSIKDYTEKIEVKNKLFLELEDYGKYRAKKNLKDLDKYIKENLDNFTQSVLFDKTYVEILLDFNQDEANQVILKAIKSRLQDFVHSIGYTIKHLILEPNIDLLTVKRDGFQVEVKDASFSTIDNRVNINLDIVARGEIEDLKKISKYINPGKNFNEEMQQVIIEEGQRQMHDIDPEEFYMPDNFPDSKPTIERLADSIKEKMESVFFAEGVIVTIKIAKTELIECIQKLRGGSPYGFEMEVFLQGDSGYRDIFKLEVEFLVKKVSKNGWEAFLAKNFESPEDEINKIKETMKKHIKEKFQSVGSQFLLSWNSKMSNEKRLTISKYCQSVIAAIFGIDIVITLFSRKSTKIGDVSQKILIEQIEIQKAQELEMHKVNNQFDLKNFRELLEKKSELLDPTNFDPKALAKINKEIEKIINRSAHPTNTGQKLLKSPDSGQSDEFSHDEFEKELKNQTLLFGNEPQKAIPQQSEERNNE